MAEACSDNRRCLPAWMMKACSSNEMLKTEDRNKQASESDKHPGGLDQIKPVRRKTRRQIKAVDTEDAGEPRALERCQGREKTRRKSKDADHFVEDEVEEIEKITSKNVRKVSARAASKNSRKRKLESVASESLGTTDDEVELTVEDLVNIAEEIVSADKENQQKLQATKTALYKEHPPCPPISTAADTSGSVLCSQSTKGLMRCTTTAVNITPSECRVDKNNRHEELQHSSSIKMTGDVAQDMLNIFLGPLLSKPAACEKKSEAIEPMIMNVNHALQKKDSQSQVQRQGEPVTKKKSSLKDKVALFL